MCSRCMSLGLSMLLIGVAEPVTVQAQAEPERWTPESSFSIARIGTVAISPDGRWAAVQVLEPVTEGERGERSAWRSALHVFSVGDGTSEPVRVEVGASAPAWSPDGRWIAFVSGRSGRPNVWRVPLDDGPAEQLTDLTGDLGEFRFAPDGSRVAFVMTDPGRTEEDDTAREKTDALIIGEEERFARLYVLEIEQRKTRLMTPHDVQVGGHVGAGMSGPAFDWSPDARSIVFSHSPSPLGDDWVHADVSVVDIATGKVRPLRASPAAEGGVAWSPDGQWIAVTVSDAPATYALTFRVVLVSPGNGTTRALAESSDRRPAIVGWTGDSRAVVVTEARRTIMRLDALPADGGPPAAISPDTLMVSAPVLNGRGTHVGFVSEAPDRAPAPYASSLGQFAPVRVAALQPPPAAPPGRTEIVRWRSFDGREIEGLLTYPAGYRAGTRVPLLTILHGGPPGVFTQTYIGGVGSYPIAAFASAGFAVFRPNVRGSSGYGREFRYANVRDWGGGDFKDLMVGIDALIERGIADGDRLGVMGWSYGGYLTAFAITQTKRFRAASVGAGITNLVSFAGTADIPGFIRSYFGADFWNEPDRWVARSPVFHVGAVTTPTLIQHGGNDLRVPLPQGIELYTALERREVPTLMAVYPRQGHSVTVPALQLDVMRRNLEWFERWVLPGPD